MANKELEPIDFFVHANTFHKASDRLRDLELSIPNITMTTLTCELYIKALLVKNGMKGWGHEIDKLFMRLDRDERKHIEDEWEKSGTDISVLIQSPSRRPDFTAEDFEKMLKPSGAKRLSLMDFMKESADAFKKFRYHPESDEVLRFSLAKLPNILGNLASAKIDVTSRVVYAPWSKT